MMGVWHGGEEVMCIVLTMANWLLCLPWVENVVCGWGEADDDRIGGEAMGRVILYGQ